jgi:hypothetical protein
MEIACKNCGEKAQVPSFLAAANQKCKSCRQPLLGDMGPTAHYDELPEEAREPDHEGRPRSKTPPRDTSGELPGMAVGALIGFVAIFGFGFLGTDLPVPIRGLVLGGFVGVLLSPLLPIGMFVSMIFHPYSVEGMAAESAMSKIAQAVNERNYTYLAVIVLIFLVLGMLLGGFFGYNAHSIQPAFIFIGSLGGAVLGAVLGTIVGGKMGAHAPAESERETALEQQEDESQEQGD